MNREELIERDRKIKIICDYNKNDKKFQRYHDVIVDLLYRENDNYVDKIYLNIRENKINDILDEN